MYITNIRTRQANNPLTRLPGPATVALRVFATDRQSAVRQFCVRVTRPEPTRLLLEYDLYADPAQVRSLSSACSMSLAEGMRGGFYSRVKPVIFKSGYD